MAADLQQFLLTTADINRFFESDTLLVLPPAILAKLEGAKPLLRTRHVIPLDKYTDVFATSDIHTDLKKLNHLLKGAGIVSPGAPLEVGDIMNEIYDGGTVDWVPENTLVVLVGDIVDGARGSEYNIDLYGNIELLLHSYLFNLRIKARAKNSELIFTVGNHDYNTVIKAWGTPNFPLTGFYKTYVHDTAQLYFTTRENRRICLLPFYNCCPYLFVNLENEVVFIHGGLHTKELRGRLHESFDVVSAVQRQIDDRGDFSAIVPDIDALLSCVDITGPYCPQKPAFDSPLWTRWYATASSAVVCPAIVAAPYKMIVVGHCPTTPNAASVHFTEILAQPDYSTCKEGGCVLVGCTSESGPSLAFVDIGMSACFRRTQNKANPLDEEEEWFTEVVQRAEFLHLKHDEALAVNNRHYNQIVRDKVSSTGIRQTIVVWAAAPKAVVGGRRRTYRRARRGSRRRSFHRRQR